MKKLTLSADEKVICKARQRARKNKSSKKRRSIAEHAAFGMWKDREDMNDALAYLRRMQKPRHVI